ncbi:MAG: hypothetical protein K2I39_09565 [Muribaculaceae bacterium]|nr:hypothetical protein [Muribaculaceae bacterium]
MTKNLLLVLSVFMVLPLYAYSQSRDSVDTLEVEPDRLYAVHWNVSFTPVVSTGRSTMELLEPMIAAMRLIIPQEYIQMPFSLLCEHENSTEEEVAKVCDFMSHTALPGSYEWFWGVNDDRTLVFGIKNTTDTFTATVAEASVFKEPVYGDMPVVAFRLDNGEETEVSKAFEDFTARNIGNAIATEINGIFIMAPKLNSSIEGGSIQAVNISNSIINKLFSQLTPAPTIATQTEKIIEL